MRTLAQAAAELGRLAGKDVRPFSTYNFGRRRDSSAVSVVVPGVDAKALVDTVRPTLVDGELVFIGTTRWLSSTPEEGVEVVLAPGQSQFDILRRARSDAINSGMTTRDLIKKLKAYDERQGIRIFHAETDTIEFELVRLPIDVVDFAEDVLQFCPDLAQEGIETPEDLAQQIMATGQVYLWWD